MNLKKIKNKNKILLLMFVILFISKKPVFSYVYNPMIFTVTAEYIRPLTINFINNNIDLGTYITGTSLKNNLDKYCDIEVGGNPGASIDINVQPTFNLTNSRGDQIVVAQTISNPNVTIESNGLVKSKIHFTSLSTILSDGIYSGTTIITAESN